MAIPAESGYYYWRKAPTWPEWEVVLLDHWCGDPGVAVVFRCGHEVVFADELGGEYGERLPWRSETLGALRRVRDEGNPHGCEGGLCCYCGERDGMPHKPECPWLLSQER